MVRARGGDRVLLLRDTQGIAEDHVALPLPIAPIVGRFDGTMTCAEIARQVSLELGEEVPAALVADLASDLEARLFCHGPAFNAAKRKAARTFERAPVRPPSHAGGAYHAESRMLVEYIDRSCLGQATPARRRSDAKLVGLVAPHIDPWRGAVGYGHAYGELRRALPERTRTFVLLGTSHAPMKQPFAICPKAFDTPLGALPCHTEATKHLAERARFDVHEDLMNHKREHSLEFQAVFLKHLLGEREARIVPILAGLGAAQTTGRHPDRDETVRAFLDELAELVAREDAVVICGADLAHVGPRFGDPRPLDEDGRDALARRDKESLALAAKVDDGDFFAHVHEDLDRRRVCGLGPMFSLLRTMPDGARGEVIHYEQNVDPDEGSIVSFAAMGFYQ